MFTYEYMMWRKHGRIYSRLSPEVKWGRGGGLMESSKKGKEKKKN